MNITGGSGTVTVGSTLYAKQGQTVRISVVTDTTPCRVELSGAHSGGLATPTSSTLTSKTWDFGPLPVGSGDGTRTVTATSLKLHNSGKCTAFDHSRDASYVADNTGPTITAAVTPQPNAAGWNNQDVTVDWSGSDAGSGFDLKKTGPMLDRNPTPNPSTQSTETSGTMLSSTGVDRLGNSGTGSQLVKLDKTKPNLHVPSSVTAEAASASGAVVSYSTSAGDTLSGPGIITPSCSRASGSTFPLGDTTVSCSATDVAGNTETKTFTVSVVDTVGPVFSNIPSIAAVEGDTLGGSIVTWTDPTATDAVSGVRPVACVKASGTLFPVGTATVTCTATDAAGISNTASFDVIVSDTAAPVLVIPESLEVEATSSAGAEVEYDASAYDTVDGDIPPVCDPASGTQLALGGHTIDCAATDTAGNKAEGSFVASVVDTTKPVFGGAPDDTGPFEATGPGGATISYTIPVANDAVSGTITGSCSPATGTMLGIGSHTVTCNASDRADNAAVPLEFTVTVQDTTPPVISGTPGNQTIEATGPEGVTASFTAPTATDLVDGSTVVNCNKESGATFPIDVTTVTCSTEDSRGNRDWVEFTIEVVDTTAPTLTVPNNITVNATSADGALVTFEATATDLVDPAVSAICSPISGSLFPVGDTIVTCEAEDTRNNKAVAKTFTVTVNPWLTFSFGGFQRPVDPQPTVNRTKAGSAVPVKFSLGGNHGLDIWGSTGPTSGTVSCNANATIEPVEETVTAGGSSLQYDSVSNTYTYVWKTDAKWASTCRQLVLKFKDGAVHRADFNFTK